MKKLTFTLLIITTFSSFGQNVTKEEFEGQIGPLVNKINHLELEITRLKKVDDVAISSIQFESQRLKDFQNTTDSNYAQLSNRNDELGLKILESETNTNKRIFEVDSSLSKKTLFGIIGVLLAILISLIMYWLLNKRQQMVKSDIVQKLNQTKSSIEESLVKEFGKQTELMENHLDLIKAQNNSIVTKTDVEPNHSFALKVASEINLIERNVRLMEPKTKGLKQLMASIGKLKDNLAANGYEIHDLLGKPFHHGMKVIIASSIPDDDLEKGTEIITKVLIPQVNFNDKMIQTAQIEVSVGY
jgi:hypothetical protein